MFSQIDRKRIYIFVAITYGLTIVFALVTFLGGGIYVNYAVSFEKRELAMYMLAASMFAPAIANIATRLVTCEGWSNTFLRPNLRRGWGFYLAALTLPLLALIMGGAIFYLLFPAKFDLSMQWVRGAGLIPPQLASEPWWVIVRETFIDGYKPLPIVIVLMLGEEFGWRAYLLPKLMPLGGRKAVLLVGVIWAVFHFPMILMGYNYGIGYWGAPVTGPLVWVLTLMFGDNVLLAWMTLRTGSVWPAALGHGVNNAFSPLMVFFLRGSFVRLIGPGPEGIVGCLGYVLLALLIFSSTRALAPVATVGSGNPAQFEKTAVQSLPGSTSLPGSVS